MALDIIILLLVVVVVFQKLWSVLGTKTTETRPISKESAEKIFDERKLKAFTEKHG